MILLYREHLVLKIINNRDSKNVGENDNICYKIKIKRKNNKRKVIESILKCIYYIRVSTRFTIHFSSVLLVIRLIHQ